MPAHVPAKVKETWGGHDQLRQPTTGKHLKDQRIGGVGLNGDGLRQQARVERAKHKLQFKGHGRIEFAGVRTHRETCNGGWVRHSTRPVTRARTGNPQRDLPPSKHTPVFACLTRNVIGSPPVLVILRWRDTKRPTGWRPKRSGLASSMTRCD